MKRAKKKTLQRLKHFDVVALIDNQVKLLYQKMLENILRGLG